MSEQWLSIVEYARAFSVSDMTIRRRIKTGKLQAMLRDGKYYIPVVQDQNGNLVRQKGGGEVQRVRPDSIEAIAAEDSHDEPKFERQPIEAPVVKSHPSAQRTMLRESPVAAAPTQYAAPTITQNTLKTDTSAIPRQLRTALENQSHGSVETRHLLEFCEMALRKASQGEARKEDEMRLKQNNLELQLKNKDLEISRLRQQIEDLQLLIKILERRPS
jgi:hypothetical protein